MLYNLFKLEQSKVPVLAGSDGQGYDHGFIMPAKAELKYWEEAGYSPGEAIEAFTGRNAKILGIKSGVLKRGYEANLLFTEEEPIMGSRAFDRIWGIVQDGIVKKYCYRKITR
jgi:imidazolonepropionase-like amidohydrolase